MFQTITVVFPSHFTKDSTIANMMFLLFYILMAQLSNRCSMLDAHIHLNWSVAAVKRWWAWIPLEVCKCKYICLIIHPWRNGMCHLPNKWHHGPDSCPLCFQIWWYMFVLPYSLLPGRMEMYAIKSCIGTYVHAMWFMRKGKIKRKWEWTEQVPISLQSTYWIHSNL